MKGQTPLQASLDKINKKREEAKEKMDKMKKMFTLRLKHRSPVSSSKNLGIQCTVEPEPVKGIMSNNLVQNKQRKGN